ncbi:MAG: 16S rRNA (uracil(1498)-N(3))-methyltransferase [Deltaproteobacteria bacterium]|nr:16S rRNA (uracil(1498)-N(3))-methyltransferase [Deltaproteobacteria bacterium]
MSAITSLLVSVEELASERLEISGEPYRHLFRARRLACGDRLRLVDGEGRARWARVAEVGAKSAWLEPGATAPSQDPVRRVRLLVASPRFQRATWLVEKATELGVAEIHFLSTERTPREYGEGNSRRLERIARSALEQSQGSLLPKLSCGCSFDEIPRLAAGCEVTWYLDTTPSEEGPVDTSGTDSTALVVGPEGGWSEGERARFEAWEIKSWSLGARVLRVETAAVVAAAWWLTSAGGEG